MATIMIELPDNIGLSKQELLTATAEKLYSEGKLTFGQGAALPGMTKREFIETFGMYCHMTPEELQQDLEKVRWFEGLRKEKCLTVE